MEAQFLPWGGQKWRRLRTYTNRQKRIQIHKNAYKPIWYHTRPALYTSLGYPLVALPDRSIASLSIQFIVTPGVSLNSGITTLGGHPWEPILARIAANCGTRSKCILENRGQIAGFVGKQRKYQEITEHHTHICRFKKPCWGHRACRMRSLFSAKMSSWNFGHV